MQMMPKPSTERHPFFKTMSQKLHFDKRELAKSFRQFANISKATPENPRTTGIDVPIRKDFMLYAVYAAECGLKSLLLKANGVDTTEKLDPRDLSHDLRHLLARLNESRKITINKQSSYFRKPMKSNKGNIQSGKLHQIYRYGGKLNSVCEKNLMQSLSALFAEIELNLGEK